MEKKKLLLIIGIVAAVLLIAGGTFAYWRWQSTNDDKTNVTFTIASDFSCSADGGGDITNDNYFAPAACTNSTYALKRTITTNITNTGTNPVNMNMWLNIDDIGTGLSNSDNFKYALTTSPDNCTTGLVSGASGTFKGKKSGDTIPLLSGVTSPGTYYLWVWLDATETSTSTMNQSVKLSLGGECSNQVSTEQTVYTVNLLDTSKENNNSVIIGSQILNTITQYNTPEAAITALETAYSSANSGATTSLPFYLKHTVGDYSAWCDIETSSGNQYNCFATENECNQFLEDNNYTETDTCNHISSNNAVTESYVGFVVTPAMATANPGMVAGTYYLKGGDNGASFVENAKTIYDAFGGIGCSLDGNSGGNPYTTTPSSDFSCEVSGLNAGAFSNGYVGADVIAGSECSVSADGFSHCNVNGAGG